mgnify:CR=1 FL=1
MRSGVFRFSLGVRASMMNWIFRMPVESVYRLATRLLAVIFSIWISPFSSDKRFIFASILSIEAIFLWAKSPAYTDWRLSLLKNLSEMCPISNFAPVDSSNRSVNCWIIQFCTLLLFNKIRGVINKTTKVVITISVIFADFFITLCFNLQI